MIEDKSIELMKTSKTVDEWNDNRKTVLDSFTDGEVPNWFYSKIDGGGLITKVVIPRKKKRYDNNRN